jgi:hypothetical protein
MYVVHYIGCGENTYVLNGNLIFKNPYGYLSADMRHYIAVCVSHRACQFIIPIRLNARTLLVPCLVSQLFGVLAGLYLVLFMYWIGISCWHRKVLLMVQVCTTFT